MGTIFWEMSENILKTLILVWGEVGKMTPLIRKVFAKKKKNLKT
jgi:hypothetical protein